MANIALIARVNALETEMAFFRKEIERFNNHIARLITTIHTLCCAISNLQDAAFDAWDDERDPEFAEDKKSESTAKDSKGNPNGSDDRLDNANDASDGANSGSD